MGLIERVAFSNRAAVTHRQTRHHLIRLMGRMQLHASHQPNELVAGLAVGYGGPIADGHPFNQSHWDLAPRPGLLVLFPSSLQHSVMPNDDPDELRCSISFDFVLTAPAQGGSPEYLAPHPFHWDSLEEPTA